MRKFFLLVFLHMMLLPSWVGAQEPVKMSELVKLTCDHPDGRYRAGEEIVFYGDVRSETEIIAEVYVNGVRSKTLSPGEVHMPEGKSTLLHIVPEEPCSVILRVFRSGEQSNFTDIGAVYEPEAFASRIPLPGDMRKFWSKRVRAMRKVPMQPVLTELPVPDEYKDRFEAYALEINCPAGEKPVRGIIAIPKDAQAKSLPIIVNLHAAGVNKPGNRASVTTAIGCAKFSGGAIALDLNAHGYRDDMPQDYYDSLAQTTLKDYLYRSASTHESFYYYGMFMREQRALDYLCTRKEWDRKRVLLYGGSQGGIQGAALAGMDRRVKMAVLNLPGFIDATVVKRESPERGCTPDFFSRYGPDDPVIALLPYYDASNFLKLTKAKLIIEAGLVDFTCPPKCVIGGFNSAVSKDKVLLTSPFRPHGSTAALSEYQIEEWRRTVNSVRNELMKDYLAPIRQAH